MDKRKFVSWWTPYGWLRALEPAAYHQAQHADHVMGRDWSQDLEAAGYYAFANTESSPASGDLMLTHFKYCREGCPDPRVLVEMWDVNDELSVIFVAQENFAAYWFDKYPALIAAQRAAEASMSQVKMTKALLAFIRHGHGKTTISEDGDENREDRERHSEERRRRAAKAQ